MNPFEFGRFVGVTAKQAADPRAMVATPESGADAKNTAMIGGKLTNLQPEAYPSPTLQQRIENASRRRNAFYNQSIRAYYDAKNNARQGKEMGLLSSVAPAIGAVAGQITGQSALGTAGGVAGSLYGALGQHVAQREQPALDKEFQAQKALFESVTPPIARSGGGENYGHTSKSYPWNK